MQSALDVQQPDIDWHRRELPEPTHRPQVPHALSDVQQPVMVLQLPLEHRRQAEHWLSDVHRNTHSLLMQVREPLQCEFDVHSTQRLPEHRGRLRGHWLLDVQQPDIDTQRLPEHRWQVRQSLLDVQQPAVRRQLPLRQNPHAPPGQSLEKMHSTQLPVEVSQRGRELGQCELLRHSAHRFKLQRSQEPEHQLSPPQRLPHPAAHRRLMQDPHGLLQSNELLQLDPQPPCCPAGPGGAGAC